MHSIWARSSAVEHTLHTGGVTGSIPVAPTRKTIKTNSLTDVLVLTFSSTDCSEAPRKHAERSLRHAVPVVENQERGGSAQQLADVSDVSTVMLLVTRACPNARLP